MASTGIATKSSKTKEPVSNVKVLGTDEDAEEVTVELFGEETFVLSTDVNGWLLVLAGSGKPRDVINFVHSMIVVQPNDGEKFEIARSREEDRFNALVSKQKHFSIEAAFTLINDLTEAAGKDPSESSTD